MSEIINRLRDRRNNVWEQAKALADAAAEENRAFSGEEEGQWQTLNAELDALDKRIKATLDGETRAKEAEDAFNKLNGKAGERREERNADGESKNDELRSFLRGEKGRHYDVPVEHRDRTTANSGGVIPAGFHNQLWEVMIETSGILSANPTVLNTEGGESMKIPRATVHSAAAAQAEATLITESDPTLNHVDLTVSKEGYLLQLSRELVDDNGVDLQGYLSRSAGRALGNAVGEAAATALLNGITSGVVGPVGTATSFGSQADPGEGFDLLIDLFYSVIAPYRNSSSAAWLLADTTAASVRKIKSTEGVYAWQPSVIPGQPDTIFGKPVFTDKDIPVPAANADSIVFGDLAALFVRIAGGFRFERSDDFAFGSDLVTYRALVRHGSVRVDDSAVKAFTHSAT